MILVGLRVTWMALGWVLLLGLWSLINGVVLVWRPEIAETDRNLKYNGINALIFGALALVFAGFILARILRSV
jgi:hypothetical protein